MPRFVCAVHTEGGPPAAFALVEQLPGDAAGPTYRVERLHTLAPDAGFGPVTDALAAEPQYAAQTTVVVTGGQRAADALRKVGPSAVAVTLIGDRSGDADALSASEGALVDTFEGLFRAGAVDVPGTLDEGSNAVAALYRAADLDAAAPDGDYDAEGDVADERAVGILGIEGDDQALADGTGPADDRPPADAATARAGGPINGRESTEMGTADLDRDRRGRIAAQTGAAPPELGEHRAVALALALACWYGEWSRDDLPTTDKADEAIADLARATGPASNPKTGADRPSYLGTRGQ